MDFDLTAEQGMLRDMTRDLLAGESTPAAIRRIAETPDGFDRGTWAKLAELGLLGLNVPEEHGGPGLGPIEQTVVLDEMGRAALPGPYFATAVLAANALALSNNKAVKAQYLPRLAAGELIGTLAFLEQTPSWDTAAIRTIAMRSGPDWVLNGTKWHVPFGHIADLFIVAATSDEGVLLFAVPSNAAGVEVQPIETVDLTNRTARLTLQGVRAGQRLGGAELFEQVLERAALGASADMLGASRTCLHMAVEYAKTREQFGQPIGSFQAIKHKCADMYLEVEESHSATYFASWALASGAPRASLAVSVAKAYVSDAARKVCSDAIQVHGGMGFTWDYDLHLYFKRAKHLEPLYGDADFHRDRALRLALADVLGD